jgi:hypothetical protein
MEQQRWGEGLSDDGSLNIQHMKVEPQVVSDGMALFQAIVDTNGQPFDLHMPDGTVYKQCVVDHVRQERIEPDGTAVLMERVEIPIQFHSFKCVTDMEAFRLAPPTPLDDTPLGPTSMIYSNARSYGRQVSKSGLQSRIDTLDVAVSAMRASGMTDEQIAAALVEALGDDD